MIRLPRRPAAVVLAWAMCVSVLVLMPMQASQAAPPAPAALEAAGGDRAVGVTWSRVAGAVGYRVYRSTTPNVSTSGTPRGGTGLKTGEFYIDSASNGTTYYYVVVAFDSAGDPSPPSPVASATPRAPAAATGDPITWATRAAAAVRRAEANGVMSGNKLYVFGGQVEGTQQTARSDVYDPATDTWRPIADLPELITHAPVVDDGRGTLWLLGGYLGFERKDSTNHVWKYDIASNSYSRGPDLPAPRGGGGAALVGRDLHYFSGAVRMDSTGAPTIDFADHYVLNLDGGTSWRSAAPVPNPRNHVAATVLNGKVYLVGGQHGELEQSTPQKQVDIYDPASNSWSRAADLPVPRGHISASTFTHEGKIFTIGGSLLNRNASDTVYQYDPATNAWTPRTSIPEGRRSPVAANIGGRFVVSGGRAPTTGSSTVTWVGTVDGSTEPPPPPPPGELGSWTTAPNLPASRLDSAGAEVGGKLYVVAGKSSAGYQSNLYAYDPVSRTWDTSLPPLPGPPVENPGTVGFNGALYVFGGSTAAFSGAVRTAYRFDPGTRTWTRLADMAVGRGGPAVVVVGTTAWVLGGMRADGASLASTERFDLRAGTWSSGPSMATARDNPGAAVLNGRIHVFGGRTRLASGTEVNGTLSSHEFLDPAGGGWQPRAAMLTGRRAFAFAAIGGKALAAGGERQANGSTFAQNEQYDPGTNTWTALAPMPTPRHGAAAGVLGGKLHVVAGGPNGGSSYSAVHEVFTPPDSGSGGGDTTPPAKPTGLTGQAVAGPRVDLAWTANGEADLAGYAVYRSTSLPVSTSGTPLSGSSLLTARTYSDSTVVAGTTYHYVVVARDGSGNPSPASDPVTVAVPGSNEPPPTGTTVLKVDFSDATTPPAPGYVRDFGQPYGARTSAEQGSGNTYGWVRLSDGSPVDLTRNGRNRTGTTTTDPRMTSLLHMQWASGSNGTAIPGVWELAVPNGTYTVTAAAGDAGDYFDSVHRLTVEGVAAVSAFTPTASDRFRTGTVTVSVSDGRLSVSPTGGTNTKLLYVAVAPSDAPPPPPPPDERTGLKVNFSTATTAPPAGYVRDFGQPYGSRTSAQQGTGNTYGWVRLSDGSPVDLTRNGRERTGTATTDPRMTSLMHMQWNSGTAGTAIPGAWELAVANGSYVVTVALGDAGNFFDSVHQLSIEDQNAVALMVPNAANRFATAVRTVNVSDGRLTLSPAGGTNTKLLYVDVVPTSAAAAPRVAQVDPSNLSTGVLRDKTLVAGLHLPSGGIRVSTLNSSTAKLTNAVDGASVPATVVTSGGGDVISITPQAPLQDGQTYRFDVTSGVRDTSGKAFEPWSSVFTVGSSLSGSGIAGVAFTKQATPASGQMFTSVTTGPDGNLYAATLDGYIFRYPIAADGSLGAGQRIDTVRNHEGGARTIIGLAFDPASTATNLILWTTVNHQYLGTADVPDWTGQIVRLSGANLQNAQDVVVGLPRSARDHMTNSLAFGPDGALYLTQGSNSAMGAPDSAWEMRAEQKLSAAVLRLDPRRLPASLPLNVQTADGGTYNPFASGAPLTLHATGVRNAYDLVWHSNGQLYVPTNGSARGGNVPGTPSTLPAACSQRIDGAWTGPRTPGITSNPEDGTDFVFKVAAGGYYGHPNPARCEWAYHGGNPTTSVDPFEATAYGVGVQPDRNYRVDDVFNVGMHASANGTVEYKSGAFGAALQGKLVVARYSASQDLVVLDTSGPSGRILSRAVGVIGMTGFNEPLDVAQHVPSGSLYVTELGGMRITRLVPQAS